MLKIHAQSLHSICIIKMQVWICGTFNKYLLNENMTGLICKIISLLPLALEESGKRGAALFFRTCQRWFHLILTQYLFFSFFPE